MTKELSKAVMNQLKTPNNYIKWASRGNDLSMKKATVIILQEQLKKLFSKSN